MLKNIIRAVYSFTAIIFVSFLISTRVLADAGCVPVYGGGVQCPRVGQVLIDKTVRNPSTGIFVDNLGPSDPKYRPNWLVTFRLIIKNTGDKTLDKVTVTDKLPDFIDFTSGPGSFDSKTKTLTFDIFNLIGGSSQLFEVKARVVHPAVLPQDKNIVCVVNNVSAVTSSQKDSDSSQFCLQKEMVVTEVPTAGPEYWILSFTGLGTALTVGLYLRKKVYTS